MQTIIRDVISVFSRGGKMTDFLKREGQNMKMKKKLCAKTQKNPYFSNSGGANAPPCPPNDVPV